jgi:hypothetical protein
MGVELKGVVMNRTCRLLLVPSLILFFFTGSREVSANQANAANQSVRMVVKLLTPISTESSADGDTFTALVVEPESLAGGEVSGKISKLKAPEKGKGKGKAEISFEFNTITIAGESRDIGAELVEVANSQGVKGVDEEGHVISTTSNKKRAGSAITGGIIGGVIGYSAAGSKGAAIGAGIGAGAGLVVGIKMTTSASNIEFIPGSQFTLNVKLADFGK